MTNSSVKEVPDVNEQQSPVPPRHERLPAPLNGRLATFDHHNARVKLFDVAANIIETPEAQGILERIYEQNEAFTKLIVYARDGEAASWEKLGFACEARIARYFRDGGDALLWTRYSDPVRARAGAVAAETDALEIARSKERKEAPVLPEAWSSRLASVKDTEAISKLLAVTFPDYAVDTSMAALRPLIARQASVYRLITKDGAIVAMACAELDYGQHNAEISDCVVVADYRGRGLMVSIINDLIRDVSKRVGIADYYSLARANQIGMNAALARTGFTYGGRLINNCRMPSGWETMNAWWRTEREETM